MPDDSLENMDERLHSLVSREIKWFDEDHNKVIFIARNMRILVLGDHPATESEENVFTRVVKKLREEYHSAIPLKDVARKGNHIHSERAAIRRYEVVIKLDASDDMNNAKAGSVGENVLIASDKVCQEKVFLFLKDTGKNREMVYSIKHYCAYFPRTYFCKDDDDMVEKATLIAVREAHRLAYLLCRDGTPDTSKSPNTEILNNSVT